MRGLRGPRALAVVLGVMILGWQAINASQGRFAHRFLVADLLVSTLLIASAAWPSPRGAAVGMLAAFAATAGVFFSAMTGAILLDGFSMGRVLAGLGLVPCLVGGGWVAWRLIRS